MPDSIADRPSERRVDYVDMAQAVKDLTRAVQSHDSAIHANVTDIAVLRAQLVADAGRITALERAVEKIFERLDQMHALISGERDFLIEHAQREDQDRVKMMRWIIATLLSVLGSIALGAAGLFFTHLLQK